MKNLFMKIPFALLSGIVLFSFLFQSIITQNPIAIAITCFVIMAVFVGFPHRSRILNRIGSSYSSMLEQLFSDLFPFLKVLFSLWMVAMLPFVFMFLTGFPAGYGQSMAFSWGFEVLYYGHLALVLSISLKLILWVAKSGNFESSYPFRKRIASAFAVFLFFFSTLLIQERNVILFSSSLAQITGNSKLCELPLVAMSQKMKGSEISSWNGWHSKCLQNTDYESFAGKGCDMHARGSRMYASCKLEEYRSAIDRPDQVISCRDMSSYGDSCGKLLLVQEAVQKRDPGICNKIDPKSSQYGLSYEYSLCMGKFQNSPEWSLWCKKIDDFMAGNSLDGNVGYNLVIGRCVMSQKINTLHAGSMKEYAPLGKGYEYPSQRRSAEYRFPVWFDRFEMLTREDFDYLKSMGANPNMRDSTGRTLLILEVQRRLFFNDNLVPDFNTLPRQEQDAASEKAVGTMRLLMDFGIDPRVRDELGGSAIDYASKIKNVVFREKAVQVLNGR